MSKKLQNINAVNQMLTGEHKFQTNKSVNFTKETKDVKKHLVGETWEETDLKSGITYIMEQKDGYVMKTKKGGTQLQSIRDELVTFNNCPKETCTCKTPNHLDRKMKAFHDMCYDCVIDMEHRMKINGTFDEYARNRMKQNALAWLERAETDVELLKQSYTTSYQVIANADGTVETLDARMTPDQFAEKVEREFQEYKEKFMQEVAKMETKDD